MTTPSMDNDKKQAATGCVGCLGVVAVGLVMIVLVMFLVNSCTGGVTYDEPSEGMLTVKCERAIAPDKPANYEIIDAGNKVYTVRGQTLAGADYYCRYKWLGEEDYSLLEFGVAGR